ncbi:MAG: iron ABC transporter permease, partial [Nitrospinota bacterium]
MKRLWQRWTLLFCLQLGLWFAALLFSLSVGAAEIPFPETMQILLSPIVPFKPTWSPTSAVILLQVRLPRVILASLVGCALAVAGVVFQAILRNPLAEPYILGVSGGAAVGTILALMLGLNRLVFGISPLPLAATLGATLTIFLVYRIALQEGYLFPHTLLLAGVIVSSFLTALIMLLTSIASSEQAKGIIFWLMGDLGSAAYRLLGFAAPYLFCGILLLYLQAGRLNILTLGEETALQLGIEVERMKFFF